VAEHRSFKDEREYLLQEIRTLPEGPVALEKLKYLREEYDWAIPDYRNSLNILSDTTYEDRKHFLLELIQNADDANYINDNAELTFIILDDGLELRYNEDGFEVDDVIAITGTGASTKSGKKNSSNSFIGEKGIGFKSVFALALEVEIESYPWHFKLLKEKCIVPEVVYDSHMKPGSGTRIKIKFSDVGNIDIISKELEKYVGGEVESFLFLQKLSKFNVTDLRNEESKRQTILLKPGNRKGDLLTLNAAPSNKLRKYLLYNQEIDFSQELVQERWEKLSNYMGVLKRNISVAALIDSSEEMKSDGRLFCFLPTKVKLPIPIFLQVDGYTKADRERLHDPENNNWNKHLLSQIPKFLLEAILSWRENERIKDKLLDYIPMEDGEDQLKDVFKNFRNLLCNAPWVKTMDNNEPWIEPQKAIMADAFFMKWFENYPDFREEAEKVLKKKFVHPKWCDKNHKRIKLDKYGVNKLSETDAVYILSLCSLPKNILKDNNITALYKYLLDFQAVKHSEVTDWRHTIEKTKIVRSVLEKCRIFPLEGKDFTCLKENYDDKVFWVGGNSNRATGIDGSFDLRMIDNEYTYYVGTSSEALKK
jgi:hypothetical protein